MYGRGYRPLARSCDGGVKPMIGEAMIGEAMVQGGDGPDPEEGKPECMNATIQTECCVGGVIGIGFASEVRAPRLGPASMPENAGR